jgi:hypothetical protein
MAEPVDLEQARAQMRAEFMRSIPDAYAGSASIRELAWKRVEEKIQAYAETYALSQHPPTMSAESAPAAPPKPAARKAQR